jgi:phosphoadenosine phosphosulfate reductase
MPQLQLFTEDLLAEALWVVRNCLPHPDSGQQVLGAFSGGKDSIALHQVCKEAGVAVEWHYHDTTIDPPELRKFIKTHYPHVIWDKPKHGNMFQRMKQKKNIPSMKVRWCCDEYKEVRGPLNCVWLVGVRREESSARSKVPVVGMHTRTRRLHVRPIANWDSEYLWDFIRDRGLAYPSLYDEGFHRLGCIGCPLASSANQKREFARWPRYEKLWKDALRHVYEVRKGTKQRDGRPWFAGEYYKTWEHWWDAWLNKRSLPKGAK